MNKLLAILLLALTLAACTNDEPSPSPIPIPNVNEENNQGEEEKDDDTDVDSSFVMPDTLRILLIGNSFAQDAVDHFLKNLLDCDKRKYVIGRLHYPSCSFAMHLDYATKDEAVYNFLCYDSDGKSESFANYTMSQAIAGADWNLISYQQASEFSGQYDSYVQYLPLLIEEMDKHFGKGHHKIFHQTWAFDSYYDGTKFKPYEYDQLKMYEAIADASSKTIQNFGFNLLVPNGTAVQNMRTVAGHENMTKDGCHLSEYLGWYLASCTWYESLTGNDVRKLTYRPSQITAEHARLAREAAHAAVLEPYKVTNIE